MAPLWAGLPRLGIHPAALVGVEPVFVHGVLVPRRDVFDRGGAEISGGEDLEIALGVPAALEAENDGASFSIFR
ncbi:MAG: hypothetical protein ACI8XO_004354 [Verrucomicrobiales bacterium]|jgi:hypothetical protein